MPSSFPLPRRRVLWPVVALVVVAAQVFSAARSANRVGLVVYNEGPEAVADLRVACAGDIAGWPELEAESSRHTGLRPVESPAALVLSWAAAEGRAERAWPVELGERLTVRLRSDIGVVEVTRSRSLGRKIWDFIRGRED